MGNFYTMPTGKFVGFLKLLLLVLVMGWSVNGWGQVSITSLPASYSNNFNSYNPTTLANATSTLISTGTGTGLLSATAGGWTFANAPGNYNGRGTGTTNTGGIWGYGSASEYALGLQRSGTAPNEVSFTVSFINNSGSTITSLTIAWDYEQWRFLNTAGIDVNGTGALTSNATLNSKDFTGTASGTNGTVAVTNISSFTLSGLSIANGTSFGMTWITVDAVGADNGIGIDNFSISATVGCTAPSTQASALTTTTPTTDGFTANWTAGNGNGTLIAVRPTAQAILAPSSGTSYTDNNAWASAGQIDVNNRVVFRALGISAGPITGLTPGTQYTATAYEYLTSSDCYQTTGAPSSTIYTLSNAPTANPASFIATAISQTSIGLTFSAANSVSANGYLIFQRQASAATTFVPSNATAYTVGNTYGDGTLVANITSNSATASTISSLTANTQYYYTIVPYNWNGTNAATYNYFTTTNNTATATTLALASPIITSPTATSIVNTTATLGGNVTNDGGSAITARGVIWAINAVNASPTLGGTGCTTVVGTGTTGVFTVNVTGLPPNTLISYTAYATNAIGTSYTTSGTFSTLQVASQLVFSTAPPATGVINTNITSFTVQARRSDNSVDNSYTSNITIAIVSGSGSLAGTITVAAVAGFATFNALQFNAASTYTINASDGSLTSATSSNIVITPVSSTTDYFRSNSNNTGTGGTWNIVTNWESSSDNLTWITATLAPTSAANTITIRNGHNIDIAAAANADQLTIDAGATLRHSAGTFTLADGAGTDLTVNGTFTRTTNSLTLTGSVSVSANGTYNHANTNNNIIVATWDPASNCNITGASFGGVAINNMGQTFGNFTWNCPAQSNFLYINNNAFAVAGLLRIINTNSNTFTMGSTTAGTYTNTLNSVSVEGGIFAIAYSAGVIANTTITNDLSISGTGKVEINGSSSAAGNLIVQRDLLLSGSGYLTVINASSSPSISLNILRDLTLTGNTRIDLETASSTNVATINVGRNFTSTSAGDIANGIVIDFGGSTISSGVANNAINIAGNFDKSGTGKFQTTSNNSPTGFVFNGGGAIQTFSYTGTNSNLTPYSITSTSSVKLLSNLTLGTTTTPTSAFTVNGTLDFQTFSIIAGNTTDPRFNTSAGATLITANTSGLGGTTNVGSLQNFGSVAATSVGGRAQFIAGINYVFNGATTTPFPGSAIGSPAAITINANITSNQPGLMTTTGTFLINSPNTYTMNGQTLTLSSNNLTIESGATLDNAGESQIFSSGTPSITIKGKFITRDAQGFTGSNTSVPTVPITFINGSTLEYAGANQIYQSFGNAQLNGTAATYVIFSGTGTKTGENISTTNPGTITIKNGITVDATNNGTGTGAGFGGAGTSLTMEPSSYLKVQGASTQPNMTGAYSLDPTSTIEIAGSSATIIRSAPSYGNLIVSGTNVGLSGTGTSLALQTGTNFTVKNGSTFNVQNLNGFSGGAATAVSNANTPTIVLENNSTINYNATANQVITTGTTNITPAASNYYNLKIDGSGTKTAPSGNLVVAGDITGAGTAVFVHNSGTLITNGIAAQNYTASTPFSLYKFTNSNASASGLSINSNITIEKEMTLGSASKINLVAGEVILKSDINATAALTAVPTDATITYGAGKFNIQRYLAGVKAWRLLATPVDIATSPTITDSWREGGSALTSTGFGTRITGPGAGGAGGTYGTGAIYDEYTPNPSMKVYNMPTNTFIGVTEADLIAGRKIANDEGYFLFVRGDRGVTTAAVSGSPTTLQIKGQVRTGDQTYTVDGGTIGNYKFKSIGNPYPSRIDMRSVNFNAVTEGFNLWNPSGAGNYNVGQWETYVKSGADFIKVPGFTTLNTIESGQAFIVQNNTGSASNVVIPETSKTIGSANASRVGATEPTLEIALHSTDASGADFVADGAMLNFDNANSNGIDNYDVRKVTNTYDNVGIKVGTQILAVERRQALVETDTIRLNISGMRTANYSFEFDPSVLSSTGLTGYLKDKYLQTETEVSLSNTTTVAFAITSDVASKAADRFMIVFRPSTILPVTFIDIAATKNNDKTHTVNWTIANQINIARYEIERSDSRANFVSIGNTTAAQSTSYSFVDAMPLTNDNYYRVKAVSSNGQTQYSTIVKLLANAKLPSVSVYPNPVVNKTIQLQIANQPKGLYTMQLVNNVGQIIYNTSIIINSSVLNTSIKLDATVAAGNYTMVILSPTGDKTINKIFVQ